MMAGKSYVKINNALDMWRPDGVLSNSKGLELTAWDGDRGVVVVLNYHEVEALVEALGDAMSDWTDDE